MKRIVLTACAMLALPAAAQAQDDTTCRNGLFPREAPFTLARVSAEQNVYFHGDLDGCPAAGEACITNSYLIDGDEVIVSKLREGFACAYYVQSDTAGWIPLNQIEPVATEQAPQPAQWAGRWQGRGDNRISITHAEGTGLAIAGRAFWPAARPSELYSVRTGEIAGHLDQIGTRARYDDNDLCEVNFTLLGQYLLAGDNNRCGGMNVSFTGVYTRADD